MHFFENFVENQGCPDFVEKFLKFDQYLKIENWTYKGLDEVNKAALLVKEKMKQNGIT